MASRTNHRLTISKECPGLQCLWLRGSKDFPTIGVFLAAKRRLTAKSGNAFPPPVAQAVAAEIKAALISARSIIVPAAKVKKFAAN